MDYAQILMGWLLRDVVVGVHARPGSSSQMRPPYGAVSAVSLFPSAAWGRDRAGAWQTWRLTRAQWRATIVFGILQNAVYLV